MLDKRLKMCADMISGNGVVCDIGTDHAYLAADLILSGKCNKVIASDVKKGPLEAAAKTVEKYGLSDKIDLVLSDGLENISLDGVSDVVIAGMGGETISEILSSCDQIWKHNFNLVLQPMTKIDVLRKWLGKNGYVIEEERIADDGDKLYIAMLVRFSGYVQYVSELQAIKGKLDMNDELVKRYLENQSKRLQKVSDVLEISGKHNNSVHCRALSRRVMTGEKNVACREIYDHLNSVYPFSTQESWDNSGMLVEGIGYVSRVLLTLDIDRNAALEAINCGAKMIISHHPVIFEPLKRIRRDSPVWMLAKADINAICMHTNVDKSVRGTNGVILRMLFEKFEFEGEPEFLEKCGDGSGLGYICTLKNKIDSAEFGATLKDIFGCEVVRYNRNGSEVKRLAFCSGSGGSMLGEAIERGCDAFITGDVKHDVWIEANNRLVTLFDCGHFHTENLVLEEIRCVLEEKFPQLEVIIAESSADPALYIK